MAKTAALIFGVIFLIAGIWGFLQSPVLGVFAADTVSSLVHVVVGIILLVVASKPSAVGALKALGVIYVVFAVLGFLSGSTVLGIFTVNGASTWLYLVFGVIMAAVGWSAKKGSMSGMPQM